MKLWRGRHCPRPVPRPGSTSARFAAWPEASACASTRDLTHLRGPHHPPHSFRLLPGNICGTLLRMHNVVDPWVRSYTHARCLSFSAQYKGISIHRNRLAGNDEFWAKMPDGNREFETIGEFWAALKLQKQLQDCHHDAIIWRFLFCPTG